MNVINFLRGTTATRSDKAFNWHHASKVAAMQRLESRVYMHFDPDDPDHFDPIPMTPMAINAPLSEHVGPFTLADTAGAIPALNSDPDATAQLYLNFGGAPAQTWGSFHSTITPAYDTDGDAGTFTAGELNNIQEIWARVAEIYSPFNINVTTVDPQTLADGVCTEAIIGGNGAWYGSAGGVAYVGGFSNGAPNVAWIFPKMLANGNTKYTAEAISHEAGHTFGLQHQSKYSGTTKSSEYNPGTAAKAPIMGNSYSASRALWWYGQSSIGSSTLQDDVAVISGSTNAFGYRIDDHGNSTRAATSLDLDGDGASGSGIIESITDTDYFKFTTNAGDISLAVSPAQYGGMLDAKLTLVDGSGTVVTSANTSSLGESISATVSSGTYYLIVASAGNAGDIGEYTVSGTIITSPDYVARPTGLAATTSGEDVHLTWIDHADNETGFAIERSSNGGSSWSQVGTAATNATSYMDTTSTVGTSYKYRIKATGSAEDSSYSTIASVDVLPSSPGDLSATSVSAAQINLTWNDVDGETSYRIDRSLNGSTWTQLTAPSADAESYSDTGLSANTKYYYRIVAVTGIGNSTVSATASATTTPAQPTTLSGVPTTTSIAMTWKDIAGETGYRVERSLDGSSWAQVATTAANLAKYTNTGLTAATKYYYRIKAIGAGGDSVATDTLTKMTLPVAPTDLYIYAATATTLKVSWSDQAGETGYKLEKLTGTTWNQVGSDLAANKVVASVTGLTEGTTYSFRVTAIDDSGLSVASAIAKGITLPAAPSALQAATSDPRQVTLTWTNVSAETGYRIERSANGSTGWKWIGTTPLDVLTFTDRRLAPSTAYYYRVRAFSDDGVGDASSTANITTPASAASIPVAPGAGNDHADLPPEIVSTSNVVLRSIGNVSLSWKPKKGATSYRIERVAAGHAKWTTIAHVGKSVRQYTDKLHKSGNFLYRITAIYPMNVR